MQLVKDRVSIITPCYNAEEFIQSHIDDVINMTYPDIEFIIVNDGSTDNTEEIILSNKERLEQRGIILKYFTYSKNKGQAFAQNLGLKHFTGEFLMWTDCDDRMYPDSITRKVQLLKENPQLGFCSNKVKDVAGKGFSNLKQREHSVYLKRGRIFWELIFGFCHPHHCIARSEAFLKIVPDREIFTKYPMQNMQMFLPLAYNYDFGYIDEELSEYVVHEESFYNSYKNKYRHISQVYAIIQETVKRIGVTPSEYIIIDWILRMNKLRYILNCLYAKIAKIRKFFYLLLTYPQRKIFKKR